MTDVSFDRLRDVALREAWSHEANDFTPWLARTSTTSPRPSACARDHRHEVLVGTFYADILARNPQDDGLVLIENQLEQTDHTHLGQIMTYLAGLEAKTVIWIAPAFREPHLSAIRWLNQHTADGFAFFALRLRVVRIGDSPYAPMFEVVEKPNGWDTAIRTVAEAAQSDASRRRARLLGRLPRPLSRAGRARLQGRQGGEQVAPGAGRPRARPLPRQPDLRRLPPRPVPQRLRRARRPPPPAQGRLDCALASR